MKQMLKILFMVTRFVRGIIIIVLLAIGLVGLATQCNGQDTTFVPNGFEMDYAHVYLHVDTVKMIVQARSYFHSRYTVNIRHGTTYQFNQAINVWFGSAFTFSYKKGSVIIFTRKKFRREYKI